MHKLVLLITIFRSCDDAIRWMSLVFPDDKSTFVQVMAWCYQATNPHLSQWWPIYMLPYDITRPNELKQDGGNSRIDLPQSCTMLSMWFVFNLLCGHLQIVLPCISIEVKYIYNTIKWQMHKTLNEILPIYYFYFTMRRDINQCN